MRCNEFLAALSIELLFTEASFWNTTEGLTWKEDGGVNLCLTAVDKVIGIGSCAHFMQTICAATRVDWL